MPAGASAAIHVAAAVVLLPPQTAPAAPRLAAATRRTPPEPAVTAAPHPTTPKEEGEDVSAVGCLRWLRGCATRPEAGDAHAQTATRMRAARQGPGLLLPCSDMVKQSGVTRRKN